MKYMCTVCGWVYDEDLGDPENNIEEETIFEEIPDDWICPLCGAEKEDFEEVDE